eukprot:jgi/Tetstr1/423212/TSEL_001331.t1
MRVVHILANFTSRYPLLKTELRKLGSSSTPTTCPFARAIYIKTTANIRADWLRRENDYNDWAFNIIHFKYLDSIWDRHIINCFASMENARLPRYNSCWSAPRSEATDSLSYAFTATACDVANTPGVSRPHGIIDDIVIKLHTSGAASTVIARHWPYKSWHQRLSEMRS